jgi:hypothetical protein
VALRRRPAGGDVKSPQGALAEDCRGVVNMNVEVKRFRLGDHGAVRVDGG